MAAIARLTVSIARYCQTIRFSRSDVSFLDKYRLVGSTATFRYDALEVPKVAYIDDADKVIADFVAINGHLCMCAEARDIIEQLEPGVHQFVPIMIVRKNGSDPIFKLDGRRSTEPYFLFNCQTRLDAVLLEKSEALTRTFPDGRVSILRDRSKPDEKLILSKKVIGDHQIWQGGLHLPGSLFFSEFLVRYVTDGGLRRLNFTHFSET